MKEGIISKRHSAQRRGTMLDIQFIIENVELVRRNTQERYALADVDKTVSLYLQMKQKRRAAEEAQHRANQIAGQFKNAGDETREQLRLEMTSLKQHLAVFKEELAVLEKAYLEEMLRIPNLAASDVPQGKDEASNLPIKHVGTPRQFDFQKLDHVELGRRLDILDFVAAAKVAGAKFYYLKNEAVLLELGLIRYALDLAMKYGFTPVTTPELARDEIISASGFSPRGPESQIYSLTEGALSLIGTSEITIGGYMANTVIAEENLPIRISGVSHCFRTEAGSSGRESKGLYRVHQFSKVEIYQFVRPDQSAAAHEELLSIEEEFYQALKLPYRVLLMCKGDLGTPAYKKYDIEAWMPFIGESGGYGEVTSASNCTDFQARRLKTRFKNKTTGKTEFVHTLNGTVVAVTRTMLAILENNQQADGSVLIPEILQPYTGLQVIRPKVRRF
ncbi:MAG: Serine-tRNA ligase [Parcubacteria group bacterium GW2011_GWC2_39_14]|nr:MAG: Serine-tRNA ligase [Parcubacteria group bacterium GW2011_GWC2_39_14]KKR55234.1 MAG: Serine-tRNA ligase [Parcubacteria group bacterium GW2011_GWA2_40_23]